MGCIKRIFFNIFSVGLIFTGMFLQSVSYATPATKIASPHYIIHKFMTLTGLPDRTFDPVPLYGASNTKYFLRQINKANNLFGFDNTDYDAEFHNRSPIKLVSTDFVDVNIKKLVNMGPSFSVTYTDTTDVFFHIGAVGFYVVDWGDGKFDSINTEFASNIFSHHFDSMGTHTIKIYGRTNRYIGMPAIDFSPSGSFITSVSGSLGNLFPEIDGTLPAFSSTFAGTHRLNEIPANLFEGLSGAPSPWMFADTFMESGIQEIPAGLFSNISDEPSEGMFAGTFAECENLKTIPENLFGAFNGAPAPRMFENTFKNCTALTDIQKNIWDLSGLTDEAQPDMFKDTFAGCYNLKSATPSIGPNTEIKLWEHFTNYPGDNAFLNAYDMADYSAIPAGWGGSPIPESEAFIINLENADEFSFGLSPAGTFEIDWGDGKTPERISRTTSGLITLRRTGLTSKKVQIRIRGQATAYAANTPAIIFTNSINKDKIVSVSGSLASIFPILSSGTSPVYRDTFKGCTGLTEVPSGLFGKFKTLSSQTFNQTFAGCTSLTTIQDDIWDLSEVSASTSVSTFYSMFQNCPNITSETPTIGPNYGMKLWNLFTSSGSPQTFASSVNFADYDLIPREWGGPITPTGGSFEIHLSDASAFNFTINATGKYTIDWGDGSVPFTAGAGTKTKTYAQAGDYVIKVSGRASSYSKSSTTPAITFMNSPHKNKIVAVTGSMGKVFPYISSSSFPTFYRTFAGCAGLKSISEDLFHGIYTKGAGIFYQTFLDCTSLDNLPSGLFANVRGAAADNIFYQTFAGCTSLTTVPENLFGKISIRPAYRTFYETFLNCTNLTTIEHGIWDLSDMPKDIGTSQMFYTMFAGCTNITSASPTIGPGSDTKLWEYFIGSPQFTFRLATQMADFADIPSSWK